jgi:hypothetical protein
MIGLEVYSPTDLDRAGPTGPEHLIETSLGLAETVGLRCRIRIHLVDIESIAGQIGDVEGVENLPEQQELRPFTQFGYVERLG